MVLISSAFNDLFCTGGFIANNSAEKSVCGTQKTEAWWIYVRFQHNQHKAQGRLLNAHTRWRCWTRACGLCGSSFRSREHSPLGIGPCAKVYILISWLDRWQWVVADWHCTNLFLFSSSAHLCAVLSMDLLSFSLFCGTIDSIRSPSNDNKGSLFKDLCRHVWLWGSKRH